MKADCRDIKRSTRCHLWFRESGLVCGLFCIVLAGSCGLPVQAQEGDAKERERLVGTWTGYAVEGRGENPDRGPVKLELVITKELIKAKQFKGKDAFDLGSGTFAIRKENSMNLLDGDKKLDNPNRKEIWLGIYQLEGDTFKWCVGKKARPSEFETTKGAFLLILKRKPS